MSTENGHVLVVGAGVGGIRSALDLAETGTDVTLIDRSAHLGGILSQLDHQFPDNHCGMCQMLPRLDRDISSQYCMRKGFFHEKITILPKTTLSAMDGEPGNFSVTLKRDMGWVDPERCTGCGLCEGVCPVEVPDTFNEGLSMRKAIFLPVPHTIPNPYMIDTSSCTHCGKCVSACPFDAIVMASDKKKAFRILVVDDEFVVRDSLKEWLSEEGFSVDVVDSGAKALGKMDEVSYELVLTDIKMPQMGGVELLTHIKERSQDVVVVMMTAYATVETAVDAIKLGALDYLVKPFDPEKLISMVDIIYEKDRDQNDLKITVDSIILNMGIGYADLSSGKNLYGYKTLSNVMTQKELERVLSGTGPFKDDFFKPHTSKDIKLSPKKNAVESFVEKEKMIHIRPLEKVTRVAFIQCAGSRDLSENRDFCTSVCCGISVKEAILLKKQAGEAVDVVIFYMDMRVFEKKSFDSVEEAKSRWGINFHRERIHSISENSQTGQLMIRHFDDAQKMKISGFDWVILAAGQSPVKDTPEIASYLDLSLNPWGFFEHAPFYATQSGREGIFIGGSSASARSITETLLHASSAAMNASGVVFRSGKSFEPTAKKSEPFNAMITEIPMVWVVLCRCRDRFRNHVHLESIKEMLGKNPYVTDVTVEDDLCTEHGLMRLIKTAATKKMNRLVIGACHPHLFNQKTGVLGKALGLPSHWISVADFHMFQGGFHHLDIEAKGENSWGDSNTCAFVSAISESISTVVHGEKADLIPPSSVLPKALVVGGGVSGMTAALAIANQGIGVELVEKCSDLGGNLKWLIQTIQGHLISSLLSEMVEKVLRHDSICVHLNSDIQKISGRAGSFVSTIQDESNAHRILRSGVVIVSTGGKEASTSSYGYGIHPNVITQRTLEEKIAGKDLNPSDLQSVIMIQCVDSRCQKRPYCSRVCCISTLKHALYLKEAHPGMSVYVLYQDMMTYGFNETYFTKARRLGVIFIQYDLLNDEKKPQLLYKKDGDVHSNVVMRCYDPILDAMIEIEGDLLILATGVVPTLPDVLTELKGLEKDENGFFKEADAKWRPSEGMAQGIFGCGISLSPRSVEESIVSAESAAMGALSILKRKQIDASQTTAYVRENLCAHCEKCVDICPHGARMMDLDEGRIVVDPGLCQGCGMCAAVCPNDASVLNGYSPKRMFQTIDGYLNISIGV